MILDQCNDGKGRVLDLGPITVVLNGMCYLFQLRLGRLADITIWEKGA